MADAPETGQAPDRQPLPPPSSTPPGRPRRRLGGWTRSVAFVPALVPVAVVAAVVVTLVLSSHFYNPGWDFFGSKWNGNLGIFGIAIFVLGSFLTAIPALFLSMLIGLGIAIASTVYLPKVVTRILDPFVDLLAGIPSIIYGLWGYLLLAPIFGLTLEPWAATHLTFIPGFRAPSYTYVAGEGLPLAIVVLTLMSLPITTLLIRDALRAVPRDLVESGLALGATQWETVRRVTMRHGSRGIWSAAFLGFGRAFGETVAVAMVIGDATKYPTSVFSETSTIAAFIFSNFEGATHLELQVFAELALLLLAISMAVNIVGRRFVSALYTQEVAGL